MIIISEHGLVTIAIPHFQFAIGASLVVTHRATHKSARLDLKRISGDNHKSNCQVDVTGLYTGEYDYILYNMYNMICGKGILRIVPSPVFEVPVIEVVTWNDDETMAWNDGEEISFN